MQALTHWPLEWPVDAIVVENGVVAFLNDQKSPLRMPDERCVLSKLYQQAEPTRLANQRRMQSVARRVLCEVPGATLARESAGRETDIDHSELAHLPPSAIDAVVR